MNKYFLNSINNILVPGIERAYKTGVRSIVQANKKLIQFSDDKLFKISYSGKDKETIRNFKLEAFQVAGVGSWELEEKLKALGVKVLDRTITDFESFELEARNLMMQYGVGLGDQPPTGWLKTNLDTAISASIGAGRWNRLNDPDVSDFYPALVYKTQEDASVREEHAILDNLCYEKDDPFWDVCYPPNGWNCRCYVEPVNVMDANNFDIRKSNENEMKIYKEEVDVNFRRNAAKSESIWEKWLDQKYGDMSEEAYRELKAQLNKYEKGLE